MLKVALYVLSSSQSYLMRLCCASIASLLRLSHMLFPTEYLRSISPAQDILYLEETFEAAKYRRFSGFIRMKTSLGAP